MPTYDSPRHGVSLSHALLEAAAVAPITRVMLDTLELYHPIGTPDGAIYAVNDTADLTATKESTATRDASANVVFMRGGWTIERAEQSDTAGTPQLKITVPNVSGIVTDALRLTRGSLAPWELIHRVYASDDTAGPAIMPPLRLYVESFEVSPDVVTITASFGDSISVSVPKLTFKRNEYPGLVR